MLPCVILTIQNSFFIPASISQFGMEARVEGRKIELMVKLESQEDGCTKLNKF
jgi:hypothetical protein